MPRSKDSFARALSDAERRLHKALEERTRCQRTIAQLDTEIPRLQQIISSLSGKGVPSGTDSTGFSDTRNSAVTGGHRAVTSADISKLSPEELAKWYANQDLTGVKSILPARPATPAPTSENETLPDDFAIGKG